MKKLMTLAAVLCTTAALCDCKMPMPAKSRVVAATQCMTDCEVKEAEVRSKCGKCSSCCGCKSSSCSSCCKPSCCKNCCRTPEVDVTSPSEPTSPDRKCSKCNCGCSSCGCKSVEGEETETPAEDETVTEEVATTAESTPAE